MTTISWSPSGQLLVSGSPDDSSMMVSQDTQLLMKDTSLGHFVYVILLLLLLLCLYVCVFAFILVWGVGETVIFQSVFSVLSYRNKRVK